MLPGLVLKLSHCTKGFDGVLSDLLGEFFGAQLDLGYVFRVLHWSRICEHTWVSRNRISTYGNVARELSEQRKLHQD